jgi:hypothetical protein
LREHLAFLAEVRGEKDDERDLAELTGLKAQRPKMHPQARAIDAETDPRQQRHEEQTDRTEAEQVHLFSSTR